MDDEKSELWNIFLLFVFQSFIETLPSLSGFPGQDLFGIWSKVYDPLYCEVKELIKNSFAILFCDLVCILNQINSFIFFLFLKTYCFYGLWYWNITRDVLTQAWKSVLLSSPYLCFCPLENCKQNCFSSKHCHSFILQSLWNARFLSLVLMKKSNVVIYKGERNCQVLDIKISQTTIR